MLCKPSTLKTALSNYMGYKPTASEHLREMRAFWIPIVIKDPLMAQRVRHISEDILTNTLETTLWDEIQRLEPDLQIAIALCVVQGWATYLWNLATEDRVQKGGRPLEITVRVGAFLNLIPVEHAALAIRNFGTRDGGKINAMQLIVTGNVTRDTNFMAVYLKIRSAWNKRGYDWNRRYAEESR